MMVLDCVLILHRYDRFTDAFEHVSTVIDDIYKVIWLGRVS